MTDEKKTPGQLAHDAFDKTFKGTYTNKWDKVHPDLKKAWEAAARAVLDGQP